MRHRTELQVRWGDMDTYQHVNNVAYAVYLQEARADLLAAAGVRASAGARHGTFVVARLKVAYLRPLVFRPAPIIAHSWITEIGRVSFTVACELRDPTDDGSDPVGGTAGAYCRGDTVLVPFDLEAENPRRVSEEERKALEVFLEA